MQIKESVALYLRISDEDEDKEHESGSITGQRILLEDYVKNHCELSNYSILQFVDDGYSGTNFNRPGIQSLLLQIKEKNIACIVVKDFSRLGRNYIEVGNYIEQVFPLLGVRFISVGDGYDSYNNLRASGVLDIGFKNLLHDLYSKDLSAKITEVKRTKSKAGKFVTAFAPYGYIKSKNDKNILTIDMECANVVRRIFQMAFEGESKSNIVRILNIEKILSPIMIRKLRNENLKSTCVSRYPHWTLATVSRILNDRRYTGDLVYGKLKKAAIGSRKDIKVVEDEWIIVPNAHEPIISRELFNAVQSEKRKHKYTRHKNKGVLDGRIKCKVCNHTLTKKSFATPTPYTAYFCRTSKATDDYKCFNIKVKESDIKEIILHILNKFALMAENDDFVLKENLNTNKEVGNINQLERQLCGLKQSIITSYEFFKKGKISKNAFIERKTESKRKIEVISKEIIQIKNEINENSRVKKSDKSVTKNLKCFLTFETITIDVMENFISNIWVDERSKIYINWTFSVPF